MAAKTEARKAKTASIWAVVGSDEAEVKRAASALAEKLVPASAGEFSRDVIDGCADNADQAATRIHQTIDALLTMPFFGGEKLVWLKSANFLGETPAGRSATVQDALEALGTALSAGLPESVRFLLSAPLIDKRRSFYKTLGKLGSVEVFDKSDTSRAGWEEEAAGVIESKARQRGLQFGAEALELFTLFTGGESRVVENELEKLDLFLGPARRAISANDVQTLTPVSRAGIVFELGNALARRDLPGSLALAEQLLEQGESAIGVLLVAIIPTVRNLLVVKDLMERFKLRPPQAPFHFTGILQRLPAEATAHLPRKKDGTVNAYTLGIAAMQAHRYSAAELKEMLTACLRANVQLVTSQLDERVVFSELLSRLS